MTRRRKGRRSAPAASCDDCGRAIDGLTDDAVRHPIFATLCVRCGDQFAKTEWSPELQARRERSVYGIRKDEP